MDPVFASLAGRNPNPKVDHPVRALFASRMGYRLLGPLKSISGTPIQLIEKALADWLLREHHIYIDRRGRAKAGDQNDIVIDEADALRRLEGQDAKPNLIQGWKEAAAIQTSEEGVSLSSVIQTLNAIDKLNNSKFSDCIEYKGWTKRIRYTKYYRRSNVLRDILSGKIRIYRDLDQNLNGLASLQICESDLPDYAQKQSFKNRPKPPKLAAEELRAKRLAQRVEHARQKDCFWQPGRLHKFLTELCPDAEPLDVTLQRAIRCRYVVNHYGGRDCPMRLYSVVDALNLAQIPLS